MVKIILSGDVSLDAECNMELIYTTFKDNYYHIKLENETKPRIDYDSFVNDDSFKGTFARRVMSDEALTDEEKSIIIKLGIKALMGEDIDEIS